MRIGILSDVHDHLHNLQPAIRWLSGKSDLLICCGDLCSPFIMDELKKYSGPAHIVFGNNDADLYRITRKSDSRVQAQGEFLELNLNGFRVAVNHFDNIAAPIARSGLYDLVCFGHNHRFSLAHYGRTIALNPGTLMGWAFGPSGPDRVPPTFAVFDTQAKQPELFQLENGSIAPGTWEPAGASSIPTKPAR
jgi:putative phosphoesterase